MKYNAKKSTVIIFRYVTLKGCSIPEFRLKWFTLHVVATYIPCKYLGNYISDDLSDDDDINRQRRMLYVQVNIKNIAKILYALPRGKAHNTCGTKTHMVFLATRKKVHQV